MTRQLQPKERVMLASLKQKNFSIRTMVRVLERSRQPGASASRGTSTRTAPWERRSNENINGTGVPIFAQGTAICFYVIYILILCLNQNQQL